MFGRWMVLEWLYERVKFCVMYGGYVWIIWICYLFVYVVWYVYKMVCVYGVKIVR